MNIQAVHAHWGYHYKIPITTKSPSLGHPHVYLPLGPLPPSAGANTVCGTITKFFFLAFLPPFLYAHTLSDSSNRIRTPRLHYKTDVKTTPPPFSHKLFVICCHTSSFSSGTNSMVLLIETPTTQPRLQITHNPHKFIILITTNIQWVPYVL